MIPSGMHMGINTVPSNYIAPNGWLGQVGCCVRFGDGGETIRSGSLPRAAPSLSNQVLQSKGGVGNPSPNAQGPQTRTQPLAGWPQIGPLAYV